MYSKFSDNELLDEETLYRIAEAAANRFNLKCLAVLCVFALLCETLNNIGIFTVDKKIMNLSSATGLSLFFFPILVWFIHDKLLEKKTSVTEWEGFKFLILIAVYAGVAVYSVILTFHAIILLAVPPIFAAQYSDQRQLLFWTLLGSIIMAPLSVYGGFFFGLPDRNLLYDFPATRRMIELRIRMAHVSPVRIGKMMIHFVFPRMLGVIAIDLLVSGIARRNGDTLARQAALAAQVKTETENKNAMQSRVIESMAALFDTREIGTGEHIARIKQCVGSLARALQRDADFKENITDTDIEDMENAAPLHDIGKIAISDTILLKPGKLTREEYEKVKTHTTRGSEMIRSIFSNLENDHFQKTVEEVVLYHHENWDGSGYPRGLKGKEIPLSARIMAVVDTYDALISERAYRKAMLPEDAFMIICSESGSHFDPDIIRILRKYIETGGFYEY